MTRRRKLRPEEQELWQAVARTAQPLPGRTLPAPGAEPDAAKPKAPRKPPAADPIPSFAIGERAQTALGHDLAPSLSQRMAAQPVRMDAKQFGRMTRGKLAPEARIDLHGMTLSEAHPELIRFVLNAQAQGLRLVLVITGKGKRGDDDGPIPRRVGVLRHQVPQWLRMPPLSSAILQVAEAHLRHGGAGAFYVYLRRNR